MNNLYRIDFDLSTDLNDTAIMISVCFTDVPSLADDDAVNRARDLLTARLQRTAVKGFTVATVHNLGSVD